MKVPQPQSSAKFGKSAPGRTSEILSEEGGVHIRKRASNVEEKVSFIATSEG